MCELTRALRDVLRLERTSFPILNLSQITKSDIPSTSNLTEFLSLYVLWFLVSRYELNFVHVLIKHSRAQVKYQQINQSPLIP